MFYFQRQQTEPVPLGYHNLEMTCRSLEPGEPYLLYILSRRRPEHLLQTFTFQEYVPHGKRCRKPSVAVPEAMLLCKSISCINKTQSKEKVFHFCQMCSALKFNMNYFIYQFVNCIVFLKKQKKNKWPDLCAGLISLGRG